MTEVKHQVLWVKRILSYQSIKKTFLLFLILLTEKQFNDAKNKILKEQ